MYNWNFEMHINGVYWKGYSAIPTSQQHDVEVRGFKLSSHYTGGEVNVVIKKNKRK